VKPGSMIQVANAGKRFPGAGWVFRGIDLDIQAGQSVALIGPSGGGKSVLLKMIAGLMTADEGIVSRGPAEIGMLFQKNALFDSFSVEENLTFPLKERKGIIGAEARKLAVAMLEAVGLAGNEQLFPADLSGGMQKRLGIARALIVEPEVILYDEPTAGLDPITSKKIADLIRDLRRKRGSTLLTVTNDMQRAYQIGDRICLLTQGRLIHAGSSEETQNARDPVIRNFIYGIRATA